MVPPRGQRCRDWTSACSMRSSRATRSRWRRRVTRAPNIPIVSTAIARGTVARLAAMMARVMVAIVIVAIVLTEGSRHNRS